MLLCFFEGGAPILDQGGNKVGESFRLAIFMSLFGVLVSLLYITVNKAWLRAGSPYRYQRYGSPGK